MSDAPRQPPPKKEVALALLEESSVFIHLDPRRPDVVVPRSFMGQPQLVLQVGLNMAIPIPDLKLDDIGITCTLSFNQRPFWCRLPWTAVYALVGEDGRGGVWADDVPPEIQLQKQQQSKPSPAKRPRPRLAAVGGGAVPEPDERAQAEASGGSERPERPEPDRLRRIPRAVPDLPRDEPAADAQPTEAPPRPAPSSNGKKPKREIPPWLRVIK